jgi:acyl-CoA hydrolase
VATGPLLAVADGADGPTSAPWDLAGLTGIDDPDVLLGWSPQALPWLERLAAGGACSVMGGYSLTGPIADGRVRYLPVRLSAVPRLLTGARRPDVTLVRGRAARGGLRVARSVGWALTAARAGRGVVVEVEEGAPALPTPLVPGTILGTVAAAPLPPPARARPPGPAELAIAEQVASLIPAGATVQHGPGAMADAVMAAISRPVRVWSGVVDESLADLAGRGCLLGQATAAYLWGGSRLEEMVIAGDLRLAPVDETHDPGRLAATRGFVALNTAIQVGLDGAVNVERLAGRVVAGIGGHADFCAGASRSEGGLSVIAVPSTHDGRSTIVPDVEVVSTARSDVDVVVTEHGMADLRGVEDAERARRLIAVAHPAHQEGLERAVRAR